MGGRSFIAALAALLCHDVVIAVCTLPAAVVPAALCRTHTGNMLEARFENKYKEYWRNIISIDRLLSFILANLFRYKL